MRKNNYQKLWPDLIKSQHWLCLLIFLCASAYAQGQTISGKILDDQGQPIPGANVLEKGTGNGTVSDAQGLFSMKVSGPNVTLAVSFIGYKTVEIPVNGQTNIDVTMEPDVAALSEVIVTGYSSERKQDLVSAVSQVSAEKTVAIPQSDIGQALQGRIAGVQVTTSGQPGTPSQIRIRGFGSFGSNTPLYVVDGVPTFDNSNINPYDIESQTVLKDAGAASIYGARASSGVIVITTKHGKYDGTTKVSVDMNTGVTMQGTGIGILSPQEQANKVYEAQRNTVGGSTGSAKNAFGTDINNPQLPDYINVGVYDATAKSWSPTPIWLTGPNQTPNAQNLINNALQNYNVDPSKGSIIQVVAANKGGTDWYKAMTRVAPVTRLSLGVSGGNDKAHYYANFTYFDQTGIALNQYLKRFNVRLNSEFKPLKNVRVGENLLLTYKLNPTVGNPQDENVLNLAYRMPTIIPVQDVNGGWAGTAAPGYNNPGNPVAGLTRLSPDYNAQNSSQVFGNVYIEIDPIKHFTLRSSFGGQIDQSHFFQLSQQTYENAENTSSNALSEAQGYSLSYTFTNSIRYENKFGNHSIKAFVGYEAIKNNMGRYISGFGLNPFTLDPNYISLTSATSGKRVDSGPLQPYTFVSLFGRVDYNWNDKYYLSATVRRDGSSVFSAENRYGVFPAVSAAWRLTSESFMSGLTWVTDLKLRGGYGIMGNTNSLLSANSVNQYTLFQGGSSNGYDINGSNSSVAPGFIPLQVANPQGKWEQNQTANIGLDGTFMNGTLEVILEVWQKNTVDLLFNPQFLATGGIYPNYPFVNVGKMVNKGIDLQVIKKLKITNDWRVVLDGNFSPISNQITQVVLPSAASAGQSYFEPSSGNFRNLQLIRNSVDQAISSFYGYDMIGYFNSAGDVTSSPTQDGAAPGRFKFRDVNGDGKIDDKDRVFMGSPVPKFTYGLNINVKYKNWSLDAFLYGVHGNKIMNFQKWYTNFYQSFSGAGLSNNMLASWTPALGNNAKTPIAESASNFSTNTQSNSWYMESGSYLRLKNLQINYDLPLTMLSKFGIQKMRFFVQAVNLFTITNYTGQDPEIVGNVDVTRGVDVGNYPATRYYGIGLNVGF